MTTRVAPPNHYHVYVIELDRTLCIRRDWVGTNGGPPVYVGRLLEEAVS